MLCTINRRLIQDVKILVPESKTGKIDIFRYWQNSGALMIKCHYSVRQWYCSQVEMSDLILSWALIGKHCQYFLLIGWTLGSEITSWGVTQRLSAVISSWLKRKITLWKTIQGSLNLQRQKCKKPIFSFDVDIDTTHIGVVLSSYNHCINFN